MSSEVQDIVAKLDQKWQKTKTWGIPNQTYIHQNSKQYIVDRMYSFSNTNNAMYHRYFGQAL